MKENLRNWTGSLGALMLIGALTLGSLPAMAKRTKPATKSPVLVTKVDKAHAAPTRVKKVSARHTASPSKSKKSGNQDSATATKKSPKSPKAKLPEGTRVNINTATAEEIARLPRVGAKAAQRLVEYRTAHQSFKSVDELRNVKGFGPKVLEGLRPHVTL